ncbi:hypothetical protein Dimus_026855 [Dionaea muscipula]
MAEVVTGDRYLESLVKFVDNNAGQLIEGAIMLKLNPVGLQYVQSRLEALSELERLISGAPVDYLRAYISDLGDHRALEQLRRILCRLTSLKVVSVLPTPTRDPTPLSLLPFGRLKVLELRGCDLSTSTARGFLELRHSLEKLICHNSTDALRHVFASRIADIKGSPQWNRLSFVSCACNGLILMDESLQLLPAIETLDLSRNKFAKVDNLRKCLKLMHLDLGFNQLRSVAAFIEVTCQISKLVLRNNALTTLRGLENLKLLEELDLSYNVISNFSELEVLSGISSLKNLWLEGNPLTCARWYRPQVFSFFGYPYMLKVDDKEITTEEFWKRQIIIARRQKRPASYGFYCPVRENAEEEGPASIKRKRISRLACIESEESSINPEHETVQSDDEILSGDVNIASDEETEEVGLQDKIDSRKKEYSSLWLQDLNEWMDQASQNVMLGSKNNGDMMDPRRANYLKFKEPRRDIGESSRYTSTSIQGSEDDSGMKILESDAIFADSTIAFHGPLYPERASEFFLDTHHKFDLATNNLDQKQNLLSSFLRRRNTHASLTDENSDTETFAAQGGYKMTTDVNVTSFTVISDIIESQSSSAFHGSPPHYQEDILHRRQYLEEEYLQLSAESFSVASSDSDTSSNEQEILGSVSVPHDVGWNAVVSRDIVGQSSLIYAGISNATQPRGNDGYLDSQAKQISSSEIASNYAGTAFNNGEKNSCALLEGDRLDMKCKKKPKKRVISLLEDNGVSSKKERGGDKEPVQSSNGDPGCWHQSEDEMKQQVDDGSLEKGHVEISTYKLEQQAKNIGVVAEVKYSNAEVDDYVESYFSSNVVGSGAHETCVQYIFCNWLPHLEVQHIEREVVVLVSSERKLYVIPRNLISDGSGNGSNLVCSYNVEDMSGVLVSLGLQLMRLYINGDAAHLFITRSVQKSEQLLHMLEFVGSLGAKNGFHFRSLEQVQIGLFHKHICGGSEASVYQYSFVLFHHNQNGEDQWVSRSLFVSGGWLFLCAEDILQFSSCLMDGDFSQYYLIDSSCFIGHISEMVVEAGKKRCTILISQSDQTERNTESCLSALSAITGSKTGFGVNSEGLKPRTWQLRWFCEESFSKFVTLIKAIHAGVVVSSLSIINVS